MSISFKRQFKKASRLVIKESEKIVRATALKLFTAIVDDTPVDTGRLRGNWQAKIGSPELDILDETDKMGNRAKNRIKGVVDKYDVNKSLWLSNNLPYADVIESGNNRVSGHFMVKRAVASFKAELAKQARKRGKR